MKCTYSGLHVLLLIAIIIIDSVAADHTKKNTPCITTEEYNPVCGSDGRDYANPGLFRCAARKNTYLKIKWYGTCKNPGPLRPPKSGR